MTHSAATLTPRALAAAEAQARALRSQVARDLIAAAIKGVGALFSAPATHERPRPLPRQG